MGRILFAWELGEHWGHLSRDLAVAQSLRAAGHTIHFVTRDSRIAFDVLTQAGFGFTQAPLPLQSSKLSITPTSYADILLINGYADRSILFGLVQGWLGILDVIRPIVVCIDHAPTALLAARIRGISVVLMGSGFEIPPDINPLPSIRPWESIDHARLRHADQTVLDTVNAVLSAHRCSTLNYLAELFAGHRTALTTFAELDHYGVRGDHEYVGAIATLPRVPVVEWAAEKRHRMFAYLRIGPEIEELLSALRTVDADIICAIPGLTRDLHQRYASPSLKLFPHAVQLESLLPGADFVISYGGAGMMASTLLAGVPLLIVPRSVEQYLGALRVETLGAGLVIRQQRKASDFMDAVEKLCTNEKYLIAAKAFAQRYAWFDGGKAVEKVVELIGAAIAGENRLSASRKN